MAKRFMMPVIMNVSDGGDATVIGGGTGIGTPDFLPFEFWKMEAGMDYDGPTDDNSTPGEWSDYVDWIISHGLLADAQRCYPTWPNQP